MRKVFFAALFLIAGSAFAECGPYLQLEGLPGDSRCAGTPTNGIDFITAEKIKFNEFVIKKTVDKASPTLMVACATGQHFKKASIERKQEYIKYEFENVYVASYRVSASPAEEIVILTFGSATAISTAPIKTAPTTTRTPTPAPLAVPATFAFAGMAVAQPVAITFQGQPATGFQFAMQKDRVSVPGVTTFVAGGVATPMTMTQSRDGSTTVQPVNGIVELKNAAGGIIGKYVFDGVPQSGGGFVISKVQMTSPASGVIAPATWDLNNSTAL